jgi:large subunit ribosomal protein L7/L12
MPEITEEQVLEYLDKMTVIQLSELTKKLEARWGVSAAAAPVAVAAVATTGVAAPVAQEEEKTEFNVILKEYAADKKIKVIQVVRSVTTLGLKEAKDLVEAVPATVREAIPKEEAESIVKKLEEVGAKAEIK